MEKLKVVIADDNRQFNMLLTEVFNSQPDFLVVGNSYDGVETLKVVEEKKPDLLMLDIIMPYLDGIGVIENLSSVEKRPNIIVISAVGQENISQKAINMGALYYFVKPFDLNIMIERVRQLLFSTSSKSETVEVNFSKPAEKKPVSEVDLEAEVTEILKEIGIPAHVRGYQFLRDAIVAATMDADLLSGITKVLYPMIAEKYNTTPTRVERAIRHAIEISSTRGKADTLYKYFGYSTSQDKGKPTNAEFIAMISDKLRLKIKKSSQAK
ncbi:sporulation transcriptional activator Spo0A [Caldicellulosiruptor acetigenus I77R1B]|jgi:two-component system response regulator (stage 0 sporulation protein A)|uniref:Stage 0 sporulation protein A homolog n=1 Tax=Caldicellulosiruptor acetigenus (strain ATCC 700853 / DSM 12137 / I77R1B) TaxID=632335 RepID=E4S7U0_CALA7|nr:sporulation transcription factor Spo0A [Caldicellulosiruptor acetigenus]ADQ40830.1 sporulation transcriptional activator Spo0A [Caldicellulosiruptor acetigenus I77R1B]